MSHRKLLPLLVALVVSVGTQAPCAADGQLVVRVVDASGQFMPARAWVSSGGRHYFEPSAPDTATPYARDQSFSCDGTFTMDIPAGPATVHVEKGKEYLPVDFHLEMPTTGVVEQEVELQRWIDMPDKGWYSTDMHIHLGFDNPRVLAQLALADDVHLIPSFTYWLRGRGETWHAQWPDASYLTPIVVDASHLVTRNNLEIERINRTAQPGSMPGATFLFNLNRPVTSDLAGEYFPTDAELCRVARQHSAKTVFDSDKPSWAETVVGVALGTIDTIQVCHNHYHRSATIPGGYGMIGPLAPGESNAAAGDGLFHRTNELYYRFLNCGFRLGVSGGSAIGVMPLAAGHHRVYARVDGELSADKIWESIKAGRTFATTGPMLTLEADQKEIGSTLELRSAERNPIPIRAEAWAIEPLESLEIVHDGRVVSSLDLRQTPVDPHKKIQLEEVLAPQRSGWIAARVLYRAPDGLLRQAHTSPIYLVIDGKPTASAVDAAYMLRWLEVLGDFAAAAEDRFPNREIQQSVLATYDEARERYREILATALRD